jgi:hypothetical protein
MGTGSLMGPGYQYASPVVVMEDFFSVLANSAQFVTNGWKNQVFPKQTHMTV